jgi:hypothetical protein
MKQIRNICITDCTTVEDFRKIITLCGDDPSGIPDEDIIAEMEIDPLLYDCGDRTDFMFFWGTDIKLGWVKNLATCRQMTVSEFYKEFAPE